MRPAGGTAPAPTAVLAPARALECRSLIHSPHDPQSWGRSSIAANDSRWNGHPLTLKEAVTYLEAVQKHAAEALKKGQVTIAVWQKLPSGDLDPAKSPFAGSC